jgi:4-hydroxybenzoate polyprenyltransferase
MGSGVRAGVALFYGAALACWAGAFWLLRGELLALAALIPVAVHLAWQVVSLRTDGDNALALFRANRFAGLLMALACWVAGNAGL